MSLYRLKPLEWEEMPIPGHWKSLPLGRVLSIHRRDDGRFQLICMTKELAPADITNRDSLSAAKAAAEQWYRDSLAPALVPVDLEQLAERIRETILGDEGDGVRVTFEYEGGRTGMVRDLDAEDLKQAILEAIQQPMNEG